MYALRLLTHSRMAAVVAASSRNNLHHCRKVAASSSLSSSFHTDTNNITAQLRAGSAARLAASGVHSARQGLLANRFGYQPLLVRPFCSNKPDHAEDGNGASDPPDFQPAPQLPATVAIPEVWPHLPVIATRRNPVFPRFMKIIEVSGVGFSVGKSVYCIIQSNRLREVCIAKLYIKCVFFSCRSPIRC